MVNKKNAKEYPTAMKITFLGTRGNIKVKSKKHRLQSSLLLQNNNHNIMIDCGADHKETMESIKPDAILLTHAHLDHAGGLKKGAPCPIYATQNTWDMMKNYKIKEREIVEPFVSFSLLGVSVTAYPVIHTINVKAVGYRIESKNFTFFYAPDLIKIRKQHEALRGVKVYIGDGAVVNRVLIARQHGKFYVGHTPVTRQIQWCAREQIPQVIITHCGSEIILDEAHEIQKNLIAYGKKYGVAVTIAFDGMKIHFD